MIGLDEKGAIVLHEKVRIATRLANVPPCLIGIEAGMASHHVARELVALGHEVKQVPPAYSKPFRQGHKNDFRDATRSRKLPNARRLGSAASSEQTLSYEESKPYFAMAAATARRASTQMRWARYSAPAWISLESPCAGTLRPSKAFGEKRSVSACSNSGTRKTPDVPAPVTATRTCPLPVQRGDRLRPSRPSGSGPPCRANQGPHDSSNPRISARGLVKAASRSASNHQSRDRTEQLHCIYQVTLSKAMIIARAVVGGRLMIAGQNRVPPIRGLATKASRCNVLYSNTRAKNDKFQQPRQGWCVWIFQALS
jgi:hypothetical protein